MPDRNHFRRRFHANWTEHADDLPREYRLRWASKMFRRPIRSTNQLSYEELIEAAVLVSLPRFVKSMETIGELVDEHRGVS